MWKTTNFKNKFELTDLFKIEEPPVEEPPPEEDNGLMAIENEDVLISEVEFDEEGTITSTVKIIDDEAMALAEEELAKPAYSEPIEIIPDWSEPLHLSAPTEIGKPGETDHDTSITSKSNAENKDDIKQDTSETETEEKGPSNIVKDSQGIEKEAQTIAEKKSGESVKDTEVSAATETETIDNDEELVSESKESASKETYENNESTIEASADINKGGGGEREEATIEIRKEKSYKLIKDSDTDNDDINSQTKKKSAKAEYIAPAVNLASLKLVEGETFIAQDAAILNMDERQKPKIKAEFAENIELIESPEIISTSNKNEEIKYKSA